MADSSELPVSLKQIDAAGAVENTWPLGGKNTFRIGRSTDNYIALPYSWVSRKHAMIQVEQNDVYSIIDLGSANGTSVNNKRILTPTHLQSGDIIAIGNTNIIFFQKSSPALQKDQDEEDPENQTVAFIQKEIVTILVCDIAEYTRLSEKIGDNLISKLLRAWTGKVTAIVRKNNGIVDKFIGDAVLAIWKSGPDLKQTVNQALMTALEISEYTRSIGYKIPEVPWELKIHAALNTGEAIIGNMGVDGQRDFTVIGNVVNIAFRLESLTSKAGVDILISGDAIDILEEAKIHFTSKKYAVRGKEGEVQTYGCTFNQLRDYLVDNYQPS
ncbi:MAG: adenylate/guanylate cyclase domain-containing protein [Proteobacteria bacterium]|nr:adenylate/guanylate cyclase domain-containing protein [Pseudomonadota bacterium]MBU1709217.1 adenylate/guanylate cyclase domain-containing protein [Pseudomonadota bacterium]